MSLAQTEPITIVISDQPTPAVPIEEISQGGLELKKSEGQNSVAHDTGASHESQNAVLLSGNNEGVSVCITVGRMRLKLNLALEHHPC